MNNRLIPTLVHWIDRHWVEFLAFGELLLMLLFVLWPLIVHNVQPGHVGVMWYRLFGGTVTTPKKQLREGLQIIWPWDKIYMYDARLQYMHENVKGLSVDGLEIEVQVSSRFVIVKDYAGYLHKAIGPNYINTLMRPQLRTLILTYLSENEASDLYSTRREQVQTVVQNRFQAALANISSNVPFDESYIHLQDVLIEEIRLPAFVTQAIEQKEQVRHKSEAYLFRLQLEEKERQRKRIEAEGIRSFQEIVAPGITDSYLRWRGIEATLQLARSNNAKVVLIGGGSDGLPIILNADSPANTIQQSQATDTNAWTLDTNSSNLTPDQTSTGQTLPILELFNENATAVATGLPSPPTKPAVPSSITLDPANGPTPPSNQSSP
ncbi:MAG: prohibitin family protein [Gammaproteobacteria bacterium]|nr:prohibitin family protein [Gammaproteobacteria bacterium]